MLQAMNTGHEGSMTTVHANTARDALARLENMLAMAGMNLPPKVARAQIARRSASIVQANRLTDGKRKVTSISEITGMEGEVITLQDIFSFRQTGVDDDGSVKGHFQASGVRPRFQERLRSRGIHICRSRCSIPAAARHGVSAWSTPWTYLSCSPSCLFIAVVLGVEGWLSRLGVEAQRRSQRLAARLRAIGGAPRHRRCRSNDRSGRKPLALARRAPDRTCCPMASR